MKQELENLLEFQKVETEIARLNDTLKTFPDRIDALDAKQTSFEEAFEKDSAAMDVLKKKYRSLESDVHANESRIAKSQYKLGAVKTNKEYQAMLLEMEEIKEMNSGIEDEMIFCLEEMESFENELSQKKRVLKQLQAEMASEKSEIRREAEEKTKQLEEAERLHTRLIEEVDRALMADYLRVKRLVKFLAVVPVLQAVCQGCHRKIPPQMFIELQRSEQLKFCPHCDRLIFWDDSLEQ
jgi:predicted  nucleic acid-binding Zn-ribbon protein